ncbi:MAG: hypothetical protein HC862_22790 [Scytonema sp. RU_4_4]|nr:hypothetical protein [Scytonema sp. RU_4_4]NJR74072.1 hypothetical protein [Scytonema sp. CRU_2_7]
MESQTCEVKQIAAQLLSGMLANPHIYASISDEGAKGQQEQELILIAIEMAESLIAKAEKRED